MLSVITVATEIDDGIATASPAARTAHHDETRRRASRYTGIAVSAQKRAFTTLNHGYAASSPDDSQSTRRENGCVQRAEPVLAVLGGRGRRPSTSDDAPIM